MKYYKVFFYDSHNKYRVMKVRAHCAGCVDAYSDLFYRDIMIKTIGEMEFKGKFNKFLFFLSSHKMMKCCHLEDLINKDNSHA